MQSDIFKCPCCFISYDLDFYLPKMVISCDHYLCLKCLRNVFLNGPLYGFACPLCKENFPSTIVTPEAFPTDYSVLQIIRNRTKIGECIKHGKKQSLYCMTDQKFLCKFCVQFEDHKGHDYHHIKILMDNTLRKKRRLEKLLEESINARMKIEEEMDGKLGEIKEFIKNQFFEMRMVLHLREGEIVQNVEDIYRNGKEMVAGGYNENKRKWEAQIADISQTDFDFQAISFMKEEHDNNDYESIILGARRELERICRETEGILGRFLRIMDLLSLYPMMKNDVSTQTSQIIMVSEIMQTIEILKVTQETQTVQMVEPREFEYPKVNEMTFGELVVEDGDAEIKLKEEVVIQPKEESPAGTFFEEAENRDFVQEEGSYWDDVKVPMETQENTGLLEMNVPMISDENNFDDNKNGPMITEDKNYQSSPEKACLNDVVSVPLHLEEDPIVPCNENPIKMEEEKEQNKETEEANKEGGKKEIQVINVETYEAPDIIDQILNSDFGARIQFNFANKEISEEDFVTHLCDENIWADETFGKVSHLEADFTGSTLTDEQFMKFNGSVVAKLKNLATLEINLSRVKISNEGLKTLEDCIGSLKSFALNCSETGIGSEGVKFIKAALKQSFKTLESLEIILDGTIDAAMLNGKEFHEMFSEMTALNQLKMSFEKAKISSQGAALLVSSIGPIAGNLESLDLNFNHTKTEDGSLEIFRTRIIPSLKKLKNLKLALGKTGLSNRIMTKFFHDLKDITKGLTTFELDLHHTCLHNPVLAQFFKNTLKEIPNLQYLKLAFSRTKVTHEGFKHFCLEAPNLKSVIMNLNEVNINDQSLEILKKRVVLPTVRKLELHIENTFVSNQAIKELFDYIGKSGINMECLNLNMAHTSVDNKSIKFLKDKVLPFMRYLGDLQINLHCTLVSQQNKDIKPLGAVIKRNDD